MLNCAYFHGAPNIYQPNVMNEKCKKTFGELYKLTIDRENEISALGYNLVVMWESKWDTIIRAIRLIQKQIRIKYNLKQRKRRCR